MDVGHLKRHELIPDSFFVRGTRDIRLKSGEEVIESFYRIRLPIFGMAHHLYMDGYCWSQRVLYFWGRTGFKLSWRPMPGAEWIYEQL